MSYMKRHMENEIEQCIDTFPEFDPDMIQAAYWDYCANIYDGSGEVTTWITNQFNAIRSRIKTCAKKTGYEYEFIIDVINDTFTDNFEYDDYSFWDLKKDINRTIEIAYEYDF